MMLEGNNSDFQKAKINLYCIKSIIKRKEPTNEEQ